jgi:polyisoprenoid-binding protein YceI
MNPDDRSASARRETRMAPHRFAWAAAAALIITLAAAAAGDAVIDGTKSSLVATFRQENVPVDAPFRKFSGHILYDPAQPASARAALEVETGSFDLGSEEYNAEVRKKGWFDSLSYPKASFVSSAIKPGGPGRFDATGTLTLKGKSLTITVPVTVARVGATQSFDGVLVISRKYFAIGDPDWNDVVDDKVSVKFHLVE